MARLDGRSREARFRKQLRAELVRHVGSRPSGVQQQLIDLAVDTAFQIELMRQNRAENGALAEHSHRVMLAWANIYRRVLLQLGLTGVADKPLSLAELMAQKPASGPQPARRTGAAA